MTVVALKWRQFQFKFQAILSLASLGNWLKPITADKIHFRRFYMLSALRTKTHKYINSLSITHCDCLFLFVFKLPLITHLSFCDRKCEWIYIRGYMCNVHINPVAITLSQKENPIEFDLNGFRSIVVLLTIVGVSATNKKYGNSTQTHRTLAKIVWVWTINLAINKATIWMTNGLEACIFFFLYMYVHDHQRNSINQIPNDHCNLAYMIVVIVLCLFFVCWFRLTRT